MVEEKFITLVTVEYWDCYELKTERVLIYATSFIDAATQIENYYGDIVESLSIKMFDSDLIEVDENMQVINLEA